MRSRSRLREREPASKRSAQSSGTNAAARFDFLGALWCTSIGFSRPAHSWIERVELGFEVVSLES